MRVKLITRCNCTQVIDVEECDELQPKLFMPLELPRGPVKDIQDGAATIAVPVREFVLDESTSEYRHPLYRES